MRQGVEQRRFELLVAARRFGLARPLERQLELLIKPFDFAPSGLRLGGAALGR